MMAIDFHCLYKHSLLTIMPICHSLLHMGLMARLLGHSIGKIDGSIYKPSLSLLQAQINIRGRCISKTQIALSDTSKDHCTYRISPSSPIAYPPSSANTQNNKRKAHQYYLTSIALSDQKNPSPSRTIWNTPMTFRTNRSLQQNTQSTYRDNWNS